MKKIFIGLVLLLCCLHIFAGGRNQGSTSGGGAASYDPNKVLDITWFGSNVYGTLPKDGSIIQREIEKRYNIRITNVPVDIFNDEQRNLMIATGFDFDVWSYYNLPVKKAVDTGLLRTLPDDLVNKYAPAFIKFYESAWPNWRDFVSVNGVLYGLPVYNESLRSPMALTLRTDWLRNVGVTTLPRTLDELENILVRFRENDPDGNGLRDTYGLTMFLPSSDLTVGLVPYLFASYGVNIKRWGVDTDGSPLSWAIQNEYRDALGKLREWWAKEIFDPELLVNSRNQNMERFARGISGGYFYTDYAIVPYGGNVGWSMLSRQRPDLDPDTMFTHIPPVAGPKGTYTVQYASPYWENSFNFGRKTSDEKVIRLLTLFNDMITDKDLFLLMYFGIEGVHFDLSAAGNAVVRPEWNTDEAQTELGTLRFFNPEFVIPDYLKYSYSDIQWRSWQAIKDYPVLPVYSMSGLITDAENEYGAATDTIATEYFWKVVTGEWNINSTWNNYVSQWRAAGGQRIIDQKKALAR